MFPAGDSWQIRYYRMSVSSIIGFTPKMLLARARGERDTGHAFNAAMLYAGALYTMDRGEAVRLGVVRDISEDLQKFIRPPEITGVPPFIFMMQGANYSVSHVTISGTDGKLGVIFDLPHATWTNDQDADAANRAFLSAFIATHADYARVFGYLVARAVKADDGSGFATVYENGKGFE